MKYHIPKTWSRYNGWVLDLDPSGAIMFVKDKIGVYCSPDWDGQIGVQIDVQNFETGEGLEQILIPYGKTFNPRVWFGIVKPFLDKYDTRPRPQMLWTEFLAELQENVEADEMSDQPVTLIGILTYAGLFKIEGAQKYWDRLMSDNKKSQRSEK